MDLLISSLSLGKAIELYKNELITAHNPRRLGRKNKKKLPSEVSKIRVKIEHTNSILKNRFMNKFWINIKGYIPDLLPRLKSWGSLAGFNPTRVAKPTTPTL